MGLSAETVLQGGEQLGILHPASLSWLEPAVGGVGSERANEGCVVFVLFIVLSAPPFCFISLYFPSFGFSAILTRMLLLSTVIPVFYLVTFCHLLHFSFLIMKYSKHEE